MGGGCEEDRVSVPSPQLVPLTKLCPHCLAENEDSAHLCKACLTPMTFFAATVPVFSIWSEMDTVSKPPNPPSTGSASQGKRI